MTIDDIRTVCVIGAGTMGTQIGHQAALGGYQVTLVGRDPDRLARNAAACARLLHKRVERGKLDAAECESVLARVHTSCDLAEAVADADLVIESIAEDREQKRHMMLRLSDHAREDAILASNSSTISTSMLADVVHNPGRLLNIHFFNPALVMRLVEVVRGPHTADDVVDTGVEWVRRIDRTPVLCHKETYGFVANRILFIAMQEAFRLVEDGFVSQEDADLAVKNGLNWPMGPFELADLVGLDVTADILTQGYEQTGEERWRPTPILTDHVDRGELGRKTGQGFYPSA